MVTEFASEESLPQSTNGESKRLHAITNHLQLPGFNGHPMKTLRVARVWPGLD